MKRLLTLGIVLSLGATFVVAQTPATQQSTTSAPPVSNAPTMTTAPTPTPDRSQSANAETKLPSAKTDAPAPVEPSTIPTVKTFPETKGEMVDPRIASDS